MLAGFPNRGSYEKFRDALSMNTFHIYPKSHGVLSHCRSMFRPSLRDFTDNSSIMSTVDHFPTINTLLPPETYDVSRALNKMCSQKKDQTHGSVPL